MVDSMKVLLVEDNPGDAFLIVEQLSEKGCGPFEVECAARLSEAYDRLGECAFDVVLLDLGLPDSEGSDTVRTMLRDFPGTPVVVLTGNEDEQTGYVAIKEGAQDYVVKGRASAGLLPRALRYAMDRHRNARKLLESESLLNEIQSLSKVGGWEWDAARNTIVWTRETYHIHDLDPDSLPYVSLELIENSILCYAPENRQKIMDAFTLCMNEGVAYDLESAFTSMSGRHKWVRTMAHAITERGRIARVVGNLMDITEQRRAEDALKSSESALHALLDSVTESLFLIEPDGTVIAANETVAMRLGVSLEGFVGKNMYRFITDEGARIRKTFVDQVVATGCPMRFEDERLGRWNENSVFPIMDETGIVRRLAIFGRDITEQKGVESSLRGLTLIDELTRLDNRRGFFTRAEQKLSAAKERKEALFLLFMDLDGLKDINDRDGHQEGDLALVRTAGILRTCFRESDLVARISGDEFVALVPASDGITESFLRERLQRHIDAVNAARGATAAISISVGILLVGPDCRDPVDVLLNQADALMYAHKSVKRRFR